MITRNSMLFDLKGKVALVTGGNGGIGFGIASAIAQAGANVMIMARNPTKNAAAVARIEEEGGSAASVVADVLDKNACVAAVSETVRRFGCIDILVNNAGMSIRKMPETYELSEWHSILDSNLTGTFICSQLVHPVMKNAGGGKIINVGSMMSIFGTALSAPYAASKGGIVQLSRSLAVAWGADNIQVNCILPGYIETEMSRSLLAQVPEIKSRAVDRTPAGRWGQPTDFAGIAVFLASQASAFVTGTAIPIDGGFSVKA